MVDNKWTYEDDPAFLTVKKVRALRDRTKRGDTLKVRVMRFSGSQMRAVPATVIVDKIYPYVFTTKNGTTHTWNEAAVMQMNGGRVEAMADD